VKVPAAAKALIKQPTLPNDYKQYLPFLPYKLAALLAWGYSESVERIPGGLLFIQLPSWAAEIQHDKQKVRYALVEAERMGLVRDLTLRDGSARCYLPPVITSS